MPRHGPGGVVVGVGLPMPFRLPKVDELLQHGAQLRQPNAEGLQAVHLAVRNGRLRLGCEVSCFASCRLKEHLTVKLRLESL